MIIDLLIIFMLISIIIRARHTGLVRQLCSALGFAVGMGAGILIQPFVVNYASTTLTRALLSLVVTLGLALLCMRTGEMIGLRVKKRLNAWLALDKADGALGSVAGAVTLLVAIWLITPLLTSMPAPGFQRALSSSRIVSGLNHRLPSAPDFVARINRLVNPNGFPDVFAGLERRPLQPDAPLPVLQGDLQAAVVKDRPSIVKIEGRGCGGIVEGSGFVAADDVVITNAHVVAGVSRPKVIDTAGEHDTRVIWFDPELDMAILRSVDLVGEPLKINTTIASQGSPGVVLGYPGGGGFTASPATILDQFTAVGRDIYGSGNTRRSVYEVRADIIPGNSGGPLINSQGEVTGLVFAQSTSYKQIGYTLTTQPVADGLRQATVRNQTVATGSCAE